MTIQGTGTKQSNTLLVTEQTLCFSVLSDFQSSFLRPPCLELQSETRCGSQALRWQQMSPMNTVPALLVTQEGFVCN